MPRIKHVVVDREGVDCHAGGAGVQGHDDVQTFDARAVQCTARLVLLRFQGETVEVDTGGGDIGVVVVGLHHSPVLGRHGGRAVRGVELDLGVPEGVGPVVVPVRYGLVGEVRPPVGAVLHVRVGLGHENHLLHGMAEARAQPQRSAGVVRLGSGVLYLFYQIFMIELREHFSLGLCIPRLSAYLKGIDYTLSLHA